MFDGGLVDRRVPAADDDEEDDDDDEEDDDDDELSSSRSQSRRYFSLWRMKGKPQKRKIRPVIFRIAIL